MRILASIVIGLTCTACGASPADNHGSTDPVVTPDAGAPQDAAPDSKPATDAGASAPFPAVTPSLPQAESGGGPVIASPTVVPVFFEPDAQKPQLEKFLTALAASDYWTAATKEYGVGTLKVAASVVVATPPAATVTDDDMQTWLASQADGTHTGWPKADANTVFAVFYPASTSITIHGKTSCSVFDGYHRATQTADGSPLIYAPIARCSPSLDALTVSAAHEIIEAATDPYYYTDPAYAFTDDDHFIWTIATVGEVTDLCELEPQVDAKLVGDFAVPRSWSNASAAAGHDPCVPAPDGPWFGAQLAAEEPVKLSTGITSFSTRGVQVPVGKTRTVDVALWSNAPTGDFKVEAFDESRFFGGPPELDLSLDKTTGRNGDILHLTIKSLQAGSYGGSMLFLQSTLGSKSHVWIGFIAN